MFSFKRRLDGTKPIGADTPADENAPIVVEPKFLVKGIVITIIAALVCAWLALCLLFYQGQWQLVLHPEAMQKLPANFLPHENVRFFPSDSGQPQLYGWWIPADVASPYASDVLLYVPDGSGSLSSRLLLFEQLHALGRNIFTFDYRGFGDSARIHPSQQSMQQDAAAALQYLTDTRHIAPSHIAIYGNGTGAVAAAFAATQQSGICCIILDNARPTYLPVFKADARTRLLPLRMLLHNEFNIIPLVQQAQQPKLFFASSGTKADGANAYDVYQQASGPKQYVDLYSVAALDKAQVATRQFLDTHLAQK